MKFEKCTRKSQSEGHTRQKESLLTQGMSVSNNRATKKKKPTPSSVSIECGICGCCITAYIEILCILFVAVPVVTHSLASSGSLRFILTMYYEKKNISVAQLQKAGIKHTAANRMRNTERERERESKWLCATSSHQNIHCVYL